jgi:hypothetical protein
VSPDTDRRHGSPSGRYSNGSFVERPSTETAPHAGFVVGLAALAGCRRTRVRAAGGHAAVVRAATSFGALVLGRRRCRWLDGRRRRRGRAHRGNACVADDARRDGRRRRVHARGARHDQVELSLFGTAFPGDVELRARGVTARDRPHPASRVVDAVRGLTVRVRREPLLPARLAVTRSDLEVEVEPVAVFEAHAPFVDRLHARSTGDERRHASEREQRRYGQAKASGPKSPSERGHGSVACPVTRCLASARARSAC